MINGLGMGSLLEDVRLQLGSPTAPRGQPMKQPRGHHAYLALFRPAGNLLHRRVVGISCTDQRCLTAGGIRIGSTPAEVARVYGAFESSSLPDGSTIFYPFSTRPILTHWPLSSSGGESVRSIFPVPQLTTDIAPSNGSPTNSGDFCSALFGG